MVAFFLDSCALAVRYIEDVGSQLLDQVFRLSDSGDAAIFGSIVTLVETGRLVRGDSTIAGDPVERLDIYRRDVNDYVAMLDVGSQTAKRALNLTSRLRCHDSIILATALELAVEFHRDWVYQDEPALNHVVFITSDGDLAKVAQECELRAGNFHLLHLFQCRCPHCGAEFVAAKDTAVTCPKCADALCAQCDVDHCAKHYCFTVDVQKLVTTAATP